MSDSLAEKVVVAVSGSSRDLVPLGDLWVFPPGLGHSWRQVEIWTDEVHFLQPVCAVPLIGRRVGEVIRVLDLLCEERSFGEQICNSVLGSSVYA